MAYIDSVALGVGQFCTNPGLVFALDWPDLEDFIDHAATAICKKETQTMLTAGIAGAYKSGIEARDASGAQQIATGVKGDVASGALPVLYRVSAEQFMATPHLTDKIFGPTSVIVTCRDEDELIAVTRTLEGQLTATLLMENDDADIAIARRLLPVLERKVGRILANGFPTGVEVSYAMVHGGPFPATSDSRSTSLARLPSNDF